MTVKLLDDVSWIVNICTAVLSPRRFCWLHQGGYAFVLQYNSKCLERTAMKLPENVDKGHMKQLIPFG